MPTGYYDVSSGANILYWACAYANISPNDYVINGFVTWTSEPSNYFICSFWYVHGSQLILTKLGGNADMPSYNNEGTIVGARRCKVYILSSYAR